MLIVDVLIFAHLTWIGLYLLGRGLRREPAGLIAAAALTLAYGFGLEAVIRVTNDDSSSLPAAEFSVVISIALLILVAIQALATQRGMGSPRMIGLIQLVTFVLAGVLVLAGFGDVMREPPLLLPIAVIAFALGIFAAARDTRAKGEPLLPDLLRSYDYSLMFSLLFSGQIVLAMLWSTGATAAMVTLLLGTVTAAIAIQVFLDPVQDTLDRVAFASLPWLREERAALRHTASALPRAGLTNPLEMGEETFVRMTRRALSNYGDLTKLASSPLVNLPEIYRRLGGDAPTTVERAAELKLLLAEAIEALKPRTGEAFGTSDEWRYYNALYFPYVVGMRPYSLRAVNDYDDPTDKWALSWFRAYVPERTLHNWQNAAAALVAQYLREQEQGATSSPELVAGAAR